MNEITIALPDKATKAYLDQVVASGAFKSTSDYVAALINDDRKRRAKGKLEALLLEGLEGEPKRMTNADWEQMRRDYDQALRQTSSP